MVPHFFVSRLFFVCLDFSDTIPQRNAVTEDRVFAENVFVIKYVAVRIIIMENFVSATIILVPISTE